MQEVFEKIKRNLEREVLGKPTPEEFDEAIYKAIKIVNQVAEDYNNGWISVNEKLPDANDLHNCNLEDCTQYLIRRRCGIMDVAHYIRVYGESYFEANCLRIKDVIEWQPLPK